MKNEIVDYLKTVRPFNSHSHHLSDEGYAGMTLAGLFDKSYCGWMDEAPRTAAQAEAYILKNGCNSYFRWLFEAIEAMYGLPFTAENFDEIARRVEQTHADPSRHIRMLEEWCKYEAIMLDYYDHPGDDLSLPRLFTPVLRCNMFAVCSVPGERDHNGNNPFDFLGRDYDDFDEYLAAINNHMRGFRALKFAVAYDLDNDIRRFDQAAARAAFRNPAADAGQKKAYYDYMIYRLCEMAGDLGIPVQFHTGLGRLDKSSPLYLTELVAALPGVKFDLFHGGFPWMDDLLALLHNFKNVWADICWLPIISTGSARRFLRDALETGGAHRILWGCDTHTSEESYGALLAGREAVACALDDLFEAGAITDEYALYIARRIWRDNGMELYFPEA